MARDNALGSAFFGVPSLRVLRRLDVRGCYLGGSAGYGGLEDYGVDVDR